MRAITTCARCAPSTSTCATYALLTSQAAMRTVWARSGMALLEQTMRVSGPSLSQAGRLFPFLVLDAAPETGRSLRKRRFGCSRSMAACASRARPSAVGYSRSPSRRSGTSSIGGYVRRRPLFYLNSIRVNGEADDMVAVAAVAKPFYVSLLHEIEEPARQAPTLPYATDGVCFCRNCIAGSAGPSLNRPRPGSDDDSAEKLGYARVDKNGLSGPVR
jgi:hypothetical protein